MGIVAEIDERHIRKALCQRIKNSQPAKARIEDANRHACLASVGASLRRLPFRRS
jgi:hypothetical protein